MRAGAVEATIDAATKEEAMRVMRTMGLAPVLPPGSSVEQSAKEYIVKLTVPGFAREELEVEIAGRFVTVRGDQTQTVIDNSPFCLHERLEERFQLPPDVDADGVTATYAHGALEVRAPRLNGSGLRKSRTVPIGRRTMVNPDASGV
jgi:HSP20 family molecular chaperone IbpA